MQIISITPEAKEVLDNLRDHPCPDYILRSDGNYDIEVEEATLVRLFSHRRRGESYSDIIIRLSLLGREAYN